MSEGSSTIKQIDGKTIHQIQSGQVIVDLCSVAKELVENAIDAGATSIDVRFKNQGLDLIEVQDNGSGISPANYASVALKHHTSKLSSYSDIAALQTFGFRGEALASLCALSWLTITTCQASQVPKGTKLTFEASGKLKDTNVTATQKGTTVSVEKLFHNLPVRRRELERTIKREWHKVIALLNQYACIQTDLKFSVSQQPTKGKRILLFSTRGNKTTRDNVINIFGAKTMSAMLPLVLDLEMQPTNHRPSLSNPLPVEEPSSKSVRIVGHVSRPVHGEGRQAPDRQMFFVNGRPCGLPQFAKTFNEVYKSYNHHQSPFILADIQLDTNLYDVNVSPDKRSILLHDQNQLLETLRTCLTELFDAQDYTIPTSKVPSLKQMQSTDDVLSSSSTPLLRKSSTRVADPSSEGSDSEESDDGVPDEDSPEPDARSKRRGRVMPSKLIRTEGKDQNLISQWVHRGSGSREPPSRSSSTDQIRLSDDKENTTSTSKSPIVSHATGSPAPPDADKPLPVRDFNKRLAENSAAILLESPLSPTHEELCNGRAREQPPIPAVQLLRHSRAIANLSQSESPLKRSMREPPTVVIGDESVSPGPDSPPAKRQRSEASRHTASFGGRLSSLFSAGQATATQVDQHDDAEESEVLDTEQDGSEETTSDKAGEEADSFVEGRPKLILASPEPEPHKERGQLSDRDIVTQVGEDEEVDEEENEGEKVEEEHQGENEEKDEEENRAETAQALSEPRVQSFTGGGRRKDMTLHMIQNVQLSEDSVTTLFQDWSRGALQSQRGAAETNSVEDITASDAESKLSLIINKGDFSSMRVAGQFNLGFIIAIRPGTWSSPDAPSSAGGESQQQHDELFIIDQHASDEKYNFERLQKDTVVQSQRLVHPKRLELTALEEEIVIENLHAINANGFKMEIDDTGDYAVGSRCLLTSLPLSRETTFDTTDLEELIALLGEEGSSSATEAYIPRPSKVRKMFAMRACRSSVMIGKALNTSQMYGVVRHMGGLDKPWNCPHGRPTMRHLCTLDNWDGNGWSEDAQFTDLGLWNRYMKT